MIFAAFHVNHKRTLTICSRDRASCYPLEEMGSLSGHWVPGVFIGLYGALWAVMSLVGHFYNKKLEKSRNRQELSRTEERWLDGYQRFSFIPCPCSPRLPIEPALRLIFTSLAAFVECFLESSSEEGLIVHPVNLSQRPFNLEKAQHATMYSFFIVSGVVDLAIYCGVKSLPRGAGKFFYGFAWLMEAMLFSFHVGGRSSLDARMHLILVAAGIVGGVCSLARMKYPKHLLLNTVLSASIIMQGTWLVQTGIVLFGPNKGFWDTESHQDMMYQSLAAGWHILIILVLMLLLYLVISCCFNGGCHDNCIKRRIRCNLPNSIKYCPLESGNERLDPESSTSLMTEELKEVNSSDVVPSLNAEDSESTSFNVTLQPSTV